MSNPFTPSFGVSPPLLAGRSDLLAGFSEALEDGPGAPGRATLYTGPRGTGKTVMLNEVEDLALRRGWLIASETATPGFIDRLVTGRLPSLLNEVDPKATTTRLTGVTAPMGFGGATWDSTDNHPLSPELRGQLTQLCALLGATEAGLLLTLDEIHRHQVDELRLLAATLQHLFREGAAIAFVGAGLSSSVSSVLNDEVLTFLRRADRHVLGPVAMEDVAEAITEPIEASGRSIGAAEADRAAEATAGYAFMIQLVGYHVWRQNPHEPRVTASDVDAGLAAAHRRLGALVHAPTIATLSDGDRRFLLAMAQDAGPSTMSAIATRLGVDANYASQYRLRLIAADVIEAVGHGRVNFAAPYLRDYLREHGELNPEPKVPRPRKRTPRSTKGE